MNMKKMVVAASLATMLTTNVVAEELSSGYDLIPRISIGVQELEYWGFIDSWTSYYESYEAVPVGGVGLLLNTDSWFTDLSATYTETTLEDTFGTEADIDVSETEYAFTAGARAYKSMYVLAGYRYGVIEDKNGGKIQTQSGPFLGLSFGGLTMGDDKQDIFNVAFVWQLAELENETTNQTEDSIGGNIKITYRRAGTPHSISVQYQTLSAEEGNALEKSQTTLYYTYNFGSLL